MSWGFKFGRPPANFAFDVSYLKNPWREKKLQDADKKAILKFMRDQKEFEELINGFVFLICIYNKLWPKENLVFAFCCSAGEYRSPIVVEVLEEELKKLSVPVQIIYNADSKIYGLK